jgi:hypothetical protein
MLLVIHHAVTEGSEVDACRKCRSVLMLLVPGNLYCEDGVFNKFLLYPTFCISMLLIPNSTSLYSIKHTLYIYTFLRKQKKNYLLSFQ